MGLVGGGAGICKGMTGCCEAEEVGGVGGGNGEVEVGIVLAQGGSEDGVGVDTGSRGVVVKGVVYWIRGLGRVEGKRGCVNGGKLGTHGGIFFRFDDDDDDDDAYGNREISFSYRRLHINRSVHNVYNGFYTAASRISGFMKSYR